MMMRQIFKGLSKKSNINMKKLLKSLLGLLILSFGCSHRDDADPFIQVKEIYPFRYEVRYSPSLNHPNNTRFGQHQFLFNIQMSDGQSVEQYLHQTYGGQQAFIMNQLRFQLQHDFQLRIGNEALACELYHLETTPFKSRGLNFNLIFRDNEPDRTFLFSEPTSFHFQNRVLGGGPVTVSFPSFPTTSSKTQQTVSHKL
jgi:hypothetical protein